MVRIVRSFVKTKNMVVDLSKEKFHSGSMASLCKENHYGIEVPTQESRRRLITLVHEHVKGIYHGDGLYPGDVAKYPLFLLGSCRMKSG
jgi:hypothetical protein